MDTIDAIKQRRSINFFDTTKTVSDDLIKELLQLASLAPSSLNLQPWKVVVVNEPKRKKTLMACAFNQAKVEEASAVLIIVADPMAVEGNIENTLDSWMKLGYMKQEMKDFYKGVANRLYGEPDSVKRKLFAVKNASLFAMNLMITAKGLGLDTHPMDGFDEDCVKKEFNIPKDKIIPMLIAVGYLKPGINLLPRAWRMGIDKFVKYNLYE